MVSVYGKIINVGRNNALMCFIGQIGLVTFLSLTWIVYLTENNVKMWINAQTIWQNKLVLIKGQMDNALITINVKLWPSVQMPIMIKMFVNLANSVILK